MSLEYEMSLNYYIRRLSQSEKNAQLIEHLIMTLLVIACKVIICIFL